MRGGVVSDSGMGVVVDIVCCVGTCTRDVSWGDSGSLGGKERKKIRE